VSDSPGRLQPGLQSACDYMIGLMGEDGFTQAEAWLREGPPPPRALAEALLAQTPADLRPWTSDGRAEAIAACHRARAANAQRDERWRQARVLDYLRTTRGLQAASG